MMPPRYRLPELDQTETRTCSERPLENESLDDLDPLSPWSLPKLPTISTDGFVEPSSPSESKLPPIEKGEDAAQSVPRPESSKSDPPSGRRLRITQRDQALFRQLARTGVAARHHILTGANLTAHRLDTLTRHGYLTRRTYVVRGLNIAIYTLAVRGQRKLKQAGFGLIYHRNARQTPHDLKLTSIYYKLPADVRETWRHEGELICELKARGTHKRGYCVDAAVVIDGQSYGVEALSRHYKAHEIEAKQQFIQDYFDGRGIVV